MCRSKRNLKFWISLELLISPGFEGIVLAQIGCFQWGKKSCPVYKVRGFLLVSLQRFLLGKRNSMIHSDPIFGGGGGEKGRQNSSVSL
jgi:hypothetical protein